MIDRLGTVCIFVTDQERAKAFYTEKLDFELRANASLAPGTASRWIAVAPKGAQTEIILYLMDENWQHYRAVRGNLQALTFNVSDIQKVCADLKGRGVMVVEEPKRLPWGTFATIQDSEGNRLLLVELPK